MSRENNYSGVVIKKQLYGESDEIVTLYTKEAGKIRVLCKASKMPASRLGPALQTFFLVNIRLTKSSSLPKVTGAQAISVYPNLRVHSALVKHAFVAAEIIMRATPDEQSNEGLFLLFVEFLEFLNQLGVDDLGVAVYGILKFKLTALTFLGLGIMFPENPEIDKELYFNQARGGFFYFSSDPGLPIMPSEVFKNFLLLHQTAFARLDQLNFPHDKLDALISGFLSYQLEREIKSERFMKEKDSVV